jgi:hypothetical protein
MARERFRDGRARGSLMWMMTDRATVTFVAVVALMIALLAAMAL